MMRPRTALFTALAVCQFASPTIAHAQTSPSPYTSGTRLDLMGREVGTIAPDPDGAAALRYPAVRKTYDAVGRLIKVESGELLNWQSELVAPANWPNFTIYLTTETTYDSLSRKLTESVKGTNGVVQSLTQYSYDIVGRPQCTAVRMNTAAFGSLPASACTLGTQGALGPDRVSKSIYDADGKVLQMRKAVGTAIESAEVTYSYTPNGKQQEVVDANGNRARFDYDGLDRLAKWTFPSTTLPSAFNPATPATALASAGALNAADYESYAYDANSNRISLRKRGGQLIIFNHDSLNRIVHKGGSAVADIYYTYDVRGLQLTAKFATGGQGITNSFDGFGRLLSTTNDMDGISRSLTYLYDANGNRTRVTHPDGNAATYTYDGLDRPIQINAVGISSVATYGYDAAGRRSSFNGWFTTTYGYDPVGRLSSLANNPPDSGSNNTYGFTWTPSGQITTLSRSNNAFAFSAVTNVNRPYTANGLNQYTAAGTAAFTYDPNGNLTSDGTTTFTYDAENRMVAAAGVTNTALRYDPLGRLHEVNGANGITRFLHDGDALTLEYDTSGNVLRRYIHGADGQADDPVVWYEGSAFNGAAQRIMRPDWQGSIVAVTTGSSMVAVNRYDEYGIPQGGNAGRFQYTGQAWIPDLGMYYYKARFYSPTLGRFMQTDPIGYEDQWNLYAYVGNDPVNGVDPSGLEGDEITVKGKKSVSRTGLLWTLIRWSISIPPAGEPQESLDELRERSFKPSLNSEEKEYEGETPDDKPEDFEPLGQAGKQAPPRRKKSDGSVWEPDRSGHGGSKWKRWPSVRDWEKNRGRQSVRPNGSTR